MASKAETNWREATDPKSGRTYYYNKVTRATQWNKPLELATPAEREEMVRKQAEVKAFFSEMEGNIRAKLTGPPQLKSRERILSDDLDVGGLTKQLDLRRARGRKRSSSIRLVRTISTIDDTILEELKRTNSGDGIFNASDVQASPPPARRSVRRQTIAEVDNEDDDRAPPAAPTPTEAPNLRRRNSTGTIYVDRLMGNQDNEGTIKCVCAVIRAHMIVSARDPKYNVPHPEYDIFRDQSLTFDEEEFISEKAPEKQVPTMERIHRFYMDVYTKSQMESECIIMSLIYMERLIKATKGKLKIKFNNWRPIVLTCMIMASKVWDDLSMWNVDFSQVCPSFTLRRINDLELAMLDIFQYVVKVSAGEYAKYYFHLRSMMARLDLNVDELRPLDIEGARQLQLATEGFEQAKKSGQDPRKLRRRCLTLHDGADPEFIESMHQSGYKYQEAAVVLVSLEQVISATHNTADGVPRRSRSARRDP